MEEDAFLEEDGRLYRVRLFFLPIRSPLLRPLTLIFTIAPADSCSWSYSSSVRS